MNIIIPLAGRGYRFTQAGFITPKPLIPINDKPMIEHAIGTLGLRGQYIFILQKSISSELKPLLKSITENPIIIEIDYITNGCTETCLLAKEYINNENPLVISNCDQILEWNHQKFIDFTQESEADGIVVTYHDNTELNSYIQLDENHHGVRLAEKEVISDRSLVGVHYWKKGKYFVKSARELITRNIRTNNEFYISLTYNMMIEDNLIVTDYLLSDDEHYYSVGTPNQLFDYLELTKQNFEIVDGGQMKGGWFIGDFNPNTYRTSDFEVGYLKHSKDEIWPVHYHRKAIEINYLTKGKMWMNNKILNKGDIFIFKPGQIACPKFLEDCEVICVKIPSSPGDKYVI